MGQNKRQPETPNSQEKLALLRRRFQKGHLHYAPDAVAGAMLTWSEARVGHWVNGRWQPPRGHAMPQVHAFMNGALLRPYGYS